MRILVFGDSITQGRCDEECFGWVNRLAAYCQKVSFETDWEKEYLVFNLGICGDTMAKLGDRFDVEFNRRCRSEEGGLITMFEYGLNDSVLNLATKKNIVPLETFCDSYKKYIAIAKAKGKIVLLGLTPIDESQLNPIPWWDEKHSYFAAERDKYNNAIQEIAKETDSLFIDLDSVFTTDLTVDGIHPKAEGHRLIFERVRDALEKEQLI